ncbi:hypothetical protein CDAR_50601 [Caerostris darwini]|uniref:non-specific serine/threonine protein kinase n=1 Tax=Caerostris darwini TaxID=1538125 RepID=A0AAV4UXG9_9ARAC|nr:hypothetical protein CDAR_50601 [Caerostris darwini]
MTDVHFKRNFQLICQGSESKIYKGTFNGLPSILKERFVKKYRHFDLDKTLTLERMRAEIKALLKCLEMGMNCPAVYFWDLESRCIIFEEITNSITVKEYLKSVLETHGAEGINSLSSLAFKIGETIAKLHTYSVIHGDLTTSNILIKNAAAVNGSVSGENHDVYLIDFGLAKRNVTAEDKAVDLYVLERAIYSSHPNSENFFASIFIQYIKVLGEESKAVIKKVEDVRARGRKRTMVG